MEQHQHRRCVVQVMYHVLVVTGGGKFLEVLTRSLAFSELQERRSFLEVGVDRAQPALRAGCGF